MTNISAPVTKVRKEDIENSNTVTAADVKELDIMLGIIKFLLI